MFNILLSKMSVSAVIECSNRNMQCLVFLALLAYVIFTLLLQVNSLMLLMAQPACEPYKTSKGEHL